MSTSREGSETRYAAVGDADVAYRVMGDGPFDLLYWYGLGSHVEMVFEDELADGPFLDALASISRLIFFDRRGSGASDALPSNALPAWEEWTDDVGAVLDAAGSERAAILAAVDAGPIAMLFAAMRPERVSALILVNCSARYLEAEDYPIGIPREVLEDFTESLATSWGSEELIRTLFPTIADEPAHVREVGRRTRASATPRNAAAQWRYMLENVDARAVLPLIQAPTLVLHTTNGMIPVEHGRFVAERIPGARMIEVPGVGLALDAAVLSQVFEEVAEFLTGERRTADVDRVLTTVLFTDIVASTEHLASVGDRRWRGILDAHDRVVRQQLQRFRGREVSTAGDGFVACFDGPGRAIRCASSITRAARDLGVEVRAGIHTGECEVRGDDLAGLAVHVAARIAALAGPSEVLVSATVKDLVAGAGIEFLDRGSRELKGVPAVWHLYAVGDLT